MKVDLHIHTVASDGRWSLSQVLAAAVRAELVMIAITDHDTVAALAELEGLVLPAGLQVVPGVEFSTDLPEHEVHILGYGIKWKAPHFQRQLALLADSRRRRAREMVDKLQELGYSLSWEAVRQQAGGASVGRPHVARALVAAGAFATVSEVFHALLYKGGPAYVPHRRLRYPEVIDLIHEAGGAAVVAHPGLIGDDAVVRQVLAAGADGLEVFHPRHSDAQRDHYLAWAQAENLVLTGGSDFHAVPGRFPEELGIFTAPGGVAASLAAALAARHQA